jgi:NADPH2:quinone reductase
MRCVIAREAGGPEVLDVVERELPDLDADEVRVDVDVAGVNYWDVMQRRGIVPLPPSGVPGVEGAGTVAAVGSAVSTLAVGQRVAWSKVPGSYASQVQGRSEMVVPLPEAVASTTAAAALMQGTTAWYLAHDVLPLAPGDSAVVLAAAGGVGHLLTQLLVERGVDVVGVVGSPAKRDVPTELGARATLVDSPTLVDDVRAALPRGASVVLDANGGPDALRDLAMLAPRGTAVYYGTASGPLPILDPALLSAGSLAVRRVRGADYLGDADSWRAAADQVLDRLADGRLTVRVDRTLPLAQAADQHARLESRASIGKLLLDARSA